VPPLTTKVWVSDSVIVLSVLARYLIWTPTASPEQKLLPRTSRAWKQPLKERSRSQRPFLPRLVALGYCVLRKSLISKLWLTRFTALSSLLTFLSVILYQLLGSEASFKSATESTTSCVSPHVQALFRRANKAFFDHGHFFFVLFSETLARPCSSLFFSSLLCTHCIDLPATIHTPITS